MWSKANDRRVRIVPRLATVALGRSGSRDRRDPVVVRVPLARGGAAVSNPLHEAIDDEIRRQASRAYDKGWKHAVRLYAIWKDGEQVVGALQRPIDSVLNRGPDPDEKAIGLEAAAKR